MSLETLKTKVGLLIEKAQSGGGSTEEIENLIDESGVLNSSLSTVEDKLSQIIEYMTTYNQAQYIQFGYANGATVEKVVMDCKNIYSLNKAFYNCTKLKEVYLTNTLKVSNWSAAFSGGSPIITIETLDMSRADKDIIGSVNHNWIKTPTLQNLKIVSETIKNNITFVWCSKLTAESVQSIFDGLDPNVTGTTLTLPNVFENAEAEAVVSANIEVVDGVTRIKGKEGWSLVR